MTAVILDPVEVLSPPNPWPKDSKGGFVRRISVGGSDTTGLYWRRDHQIEIAYRDSGGTLRWEGPFETISDALVRRSSVLEIKKESKQQQRDRLLRGEHSIEELVAFFYYEHDQFAKAATRAVEHAISAGEVLLIAKKKIPRGEWLNWLDENVIGPGRGLAVINTYMRLARYQDVLAEERPETINEARLLVKGLSETRPDNELRDMVLLLQEQGLSRAAISKNLEITRSAVERILSPQSYERSRIIRRQQQRDARRALRRSEQDKMVRLAGGNLAEAYSLIRKALQRLDAAESEATDREVREGIASAIRRLHGAEDQIGKAVKIS